MAARAIDFARSAVTWLLPEQPSRGRFAIDAALRLPDGDAYYLCAQVFACDVYGTGPLFRDPPYEFAAAFSRTHYVIFRDAARGASTGDTSGPVSSRFRELDLDIADVAARSVPAPEGGQGPGLPLSARVAFVDGSELEFPVRHFNWRPDGRYQVETGPLLTCLPGAGVPPASLRRAYAAWNRADAIELLVDAQRPSVPGARWGRPVAAACRIELLRPDA